MNICCKNNLPDKSHSIRSRFRNNSNLFYSFEYRNKLLEDVKFDDKELIEMSSSQMNYALDNLPI